MDNRIAVALAATALAVHADDHDREREHKMLSGLLSFTVKINTDQLTQKLGPLDEVLQSKIELALRQNGIPVVSEIECGLAAPRCGMLIFSLSLTEGSHPSNVPVFEYAFNARLRAYAGAMLIHNRSGPYLLPVFEREHFGTVGAQRMDTLPQILD